MTPAIIRLIRPGDWVKNVFVLVAPVFALPPFIGTLTDDPAGVDVGPVGPALAATAAAFVAFCLLSSGFYCINDVFDVRSDRMHPVKRRRPVATGEVGLRTAAVLGVALVAGGILLGALINLALAVILLIYAVLQVLYNVRLKRAMLVDVVTVATGFALRAAAGAVAIEVQISIWLLLCVFFLCLYLGFVKRLCDLTSAEAQGSAGWTPAAGYDDRSELNWLLGISAVLAIVTFLMYTLSGHAQEIFGARAVGLSLLTPLVIISIHRFYRRARVGLSDSPLAALREDRAVMASVILFAAGTLATLYVPGMDRAIVSLFYLTGEAGSP
ncbi:MAG: UbiA prenyltransferase family protein [Planctomycetota bacterium]|jgi:4-hydroxybenzoate polyprenyltransferase